MEQEARDREQLTPILELIGRIENRLRDRDRAAFDSDIDEIDLTAFRLAHIGEAARKLSPKITERHPELPWRDMMGMRNLISHNYGGINPGPLWSTAKQELSKLAEVCRAELDRPKT
jgi:uncharacterized protein with HEPN domain